MTELDLFDLNKPVDLYRIIHEVYNSMFKFLSLEKQQANG